MVYRGAILRTINNTEPIWSVTREEAKSRVIKLYKTWYRQIPHIVDDYNLPKTTRQCHQKLHTEFMKNSDIHDIRRIDTLALNGQIELVQMSCLKKPRSQVLKYWANDNNEQSRPKKFLSKFLVGQN